MGCQHRVSNFASLQTQSTPSEDKQREGDAQTFGVKEEGDCVNLGWDGFNFLSRR